MERNQIHDLTSIEIDKVNMAIQNGIQENYSIQKVLCDIMTSCPHKRMNDAMIIFQCYLYLVIYGEGLTVETWQRFLTDPDRYSPYSKLLRDTADFGKVYNHRRKLIDLLNEMNSQTITGNIMQQQPIQQPYMYQQFVDQSIPQGLPQQQVLVGSPQQMFETQTPSPIQQSQMTPMNTGMQPKMTIHAIPMPCNGMIQSQQSQPEMYQIQTGGMTTQSPQQQMSPVTPMMMGNMNPCVQPGYQTQMPMNQGYGQQGFTMNTMGMMQSTQPTQSNQPNRQQLTFNVDEQFVMNFSNMMQRDMGYNQDTMNIQYQVSDQQSLNSQYIGETVPPPPCDVSNQQYMTDQQGDQMQYQQQNNGY